jgi:hypothetical protein
LQETFFSAIGHCQHQTAHGRPSFDKDRRVIRRQLQSLLIDLVLPWSLGNEDRPNEFKTPVRIEVVLVEGQISVVGWGSKNETGSM